MEDKPASRNSRKKNGESGKEKNVGWMRVLQVTSIIAILAALSILYSHWLLNDAYKYKPHETQPTVDMSKAVLIDGIAFNKPNPKFTESVKEIMGKANLTLDIYEGETVTIDLLRKIGGYGLIILRVHSAIDQKHGFLYLFSAERFDDAEYNARYSYEERITGAVREGVTFENESYLTLRADLLGYMGSGGLKGSTIILMGCNGTEQDTINRLLKKGVKAIIAWDGYVDLGYTDKITAGLLKAVYEDGAGFLEAVEKIMSDEGADPVWNSRLKCLTLLESG